MGIKRDRESTDMSNNTTTDTITEDEAALYDRQIRLWGINCQKRLRESKILIVGLNGLGAEVVKNLTLSGVKSITIIDETPVSELDFSSQFFVAGAALGERRSEASKAAIQELNPNVTIEIDSEDISSKSTEFFSEFSAVFATDCPLNVLIKVNKICHERGIKFFCGDTWGFFGYGFLDLIKHKYSCEKITKEDTNIGEISKQIFGTLEYCPLGPALGVKVGCGLSKRPNKVYLLLNIMNNFRERYGRFPLPASREEDIELLKGVRRFTLTNLGYEENKFNDEMLSCIFGELSPVCAAVGGVMANEIIKGISGNQQPIYNFLLFDGETCSGVVETIVVRD